MKSHCQFIENSHRNKFKYRLESLFSRNLFPTFKYTKLAAVKRGHTFTLKCTLKAIYNLNPRKPRPSPQTIHHNGGHSHFSQVTAHPQTVAILFFIIQDTGRRRLTGATNWVLPRYLLALKMPLVYSILYWTQVRFQCVLLITSACHVFFSSSRSTRKVTAVN